MNKKFLYFNIFLFIALFIFGGFFFGSKTQDKIKTSLIPNPVKSDIGGSEISAKVVYVVDGDTVKVLINNKEDTVRLIGIDSPEVLDERKPVQCFGREASSKAKEILTGKAIVLESDPTQENRDEYGRLLRYVFLGNQNFNKLMISEGYAREYTFKGNSYKYQSEFKNAEEKARENGKGLWANNVCD